MDSNPWPWFDTEGILRPDNEDDATAVHGQREPGDAEVEAEDSDEDAAARLGKVLCKALQTFLVVYSAIKPDTVDTALNAIEAIFKINEVCEHRPAQPLTPSLQPLEHPTPPTFLLVATHMDMVLPAEASAL